MELEGVDPLIPGPLWFARSVLVAGEVVPGCRAGPVDDEVAAILSLGRTVGEPFDFPESFDQVSLFPVVEAVARSEERGREASEEELSTGLAVEESQDPLSATVSAARGHSAIVSKIDNFQSLPFSSICDFKREIIAQDLRAAAS